MKNLILTLTCLLCCLLATNAQQPVKKALNGINYSNLPFTLSKGYCFEQGFGIENPNYIMPDKLYYNFQLTDYFLARNEVETAGALRMKFKLRNGTDLGIVDFGGATDWLTYDLITISNTGQIIDALEVGIGVAWVMPKQFRITADEKIIVTQLIPTTKSSVAMDDFSQITGYIVDTTYHIDASGKFIKDSETKHSPRTFTQDQLDSSGINLWDLY